MKVSQSQGSRELAVANSRTEKQKKKLCINYETKSPHKNKKISLSHCEFQFFLRVWFYLYLICVVIGEIAVIGVGQ